VPLQAPRPRSLPELLAAGTGGVVIGAVLVAAVDGLFALAGLGRFGDASGMFAALPAAFVYYDEYRKLRRTGMALLCAVLAVVLGAGAGYAVSGAAPPLVSGAVAALAAVVVYALLWHAGTKHLEGVAK
jgi:hypothetical protein